MLDAHPVPARPVALLVTTALLACVSAAALLCGAWVVAGAVAVVAALPVRRHPVDRGLGEAAAHLALGWAVFGLLPLLVGLTLGGPYAAPVPVLSALLLAAALRIAALRRESARRWSSPAWLVGVVAEPAPVDRALEAALRAPEEERRALLDQAVVALAHAPPEAVPREAAARRALWINVYNVLAAHASRGRRSRAMDDVLEVFRTRYRLFGATLSLNDLEHGLLRDNAPAPGWSARQLRPDDPRSAWRVPLDPRIHFALNCASRSCPPIRVYDGPNLDAQLSLAEQSFLEGETTFDPDTRRATTSKILKWYAADFAGPAGVRARLARVLGRPELRDADLAFHSYDWAVPGSG